MLKSVYILVFSIIDIRHVFPHFQCNMSRYLTPSKVGLLALISLYTESVIPSKATIPVLSFLVSYLLPVNSTASHSKGELHPRKVPLTIEEFQRVTICHASGIPGRNVWDLLIHKLWKIDSCDALHVFFDTLSFLLKKTAEEQSKEVGDEVDLISNRILLSRVSPLGSFVRRAQVEFTRLPFHDGVALWKAFVSYRAPTFPQWKKRNPNAGNTNFDKNLHGNGLTWKDSLTNLIYGEFEHEGRQQEASISTEDVERLLEYQVEHMQSSFSTQQRGLHACANRVLRDGQSASTRNESQVPSHASGERRST